uniref:Uncharacterized protein n=1 Tax=Siphoviridae sp. ctmP19 TaxID=2825651 RepID=A0A8S5PIC1_9CAUD|nr:MAG TPA: hypothetical protein [Siphoviridae sp. ctmP19]
MLIFNYFKWIPFVFLGVLVLYMSLFCCFFVS